MKLVTVAVVSWALVAAAEAQTVRVNESAVGGVTVDLRPGGLSAPAFGAASPNLTNSALSAIHQQLAASSINTDNIVTVLPAMTDDGLALFHLIDRESGAFTGFDARIDFAGVAYDMDASGVRAWVNDAGQELFQALNVNPFANSSAILATFQWDARTTGDGAAFSGLTAGDGGTSVFSPFQGFGLTGVSRGFQYLSYEGGAWTVAHTGSFNADLSATSFDWSVIPSPGAAAVMALGGALAWRRRR